MGVFFNEKMSAPTLKFASGNSASTTLSSSISDSATAAPLTSDTNFAAKSGEGMVIADEGQATEEIAYATGKSGASLTIPLANRGLEGGSAQAHASGATVKGILTAGMWNDLVTALTDNLLVQATGVTKAGIALTSPKVTTSINDSGDNELIKVTATASAVNEITLANAATGGAPSVTASGGDTDIGLALVTKGTGLLKVNMQHQANTTNANKGDVFMQCGWGHITGDGSSSRLSETVTYPVAFPNELLSLQITLNGMKNTGGDPASFIDSPNTTDETVSYRTYSQSLSNFKAEFEQTSASSNEVRYLYSWIAIGR